MKQILNRKKVEYQRTADGQHVLLTLTAMNCGMLKATKGVPGIPDMLRIEGQSEKKYQTHSIEIPVRI